MAEERAIAENRLEHRPAPRVVGLGGGEGRQFRVVGLARALAPAVQADGGAFAVRGRRQRPRIEHGGRILHDRPFGFFAHC
jgi:hypothetical protein